MATTVKIYPLNAASQYWRGSTHTNASNNANGFAGKADFEYIWPVPFNLTGYAGKTLVSLKFFAKRDDSESNSVGAARTISTGHASSDGTLAAVTTGRVDHGNARSMPDGDNWVSWDISAAWGVLQAGTQYIVLRGNTSAYTGFFTNYSGVPSGDRPYIELIYQDLPALTAPGKPSTPATITGDHGSTTWAGSTDPNGVAPQGEIGYIVAVSKNNGATWYNYPVGGALSYEHDFWDFLDMVVGTDKTDVCQFAVQAVWGAYSSAWAYSDTFAVDYRITPPPPTVTAIPTVTGDGYTFSWSEVGPPNGTSPASQTDYETDISNGASWLSGATVYDATQRTINNLHSLLGVPLGRYYVNGAMRFSVRAKVVTGHGAWYSSYVQPTFTIDWRLAPSAIPAPTISKNPAYEGESIVLTCKRPASYNPQDSGGNVNSLTFIAWRESYGEVGRTTIAVNNSLFTSGDGAIPISVVVGNWATGLNDINTSFRVLVRDEDGATVLDSAWSAVSAFTCKRFRPPTIAVTLDGRTAGTVAAKVVVLDTGFGGTQVKDQIRGMRYKLGTGPFLPATLGSWVGLSTSFSISGLSAEGRYDVTIDASNVGPVLGDKTSAVYSSQILEFTPALFAWYDPTTGYSGAATKSLIVGDDYNDSTTPVLPGWIRAKGFLLSADAIRQTFNRPSGGVNRYSGLLFQDNLVSKNGLFYDYTSNEFYVGLNADKKVHHDGNFDVNHSALPNMNSSNWFPAGVHSNAASANPNAVGLAFVRDGYYAMNFGFDTDNLPKWSMPGVGGPWKFWTEQNFNPAGITNFKGIVITGGRNTASGGAAADALGGLAFHLPDNGEPDNYGARLWLDATGSGSPNDTRLTVRMRSFAPFSDAESTIAWFSDAGNFWVNYMCSAAVFEDRTPGYVGDDALSEILAIRNDEFGNIDHETLPECARTKRVIRKGLTKSMVLDGEVQRVQLTPDEVEPGRNLGIMISAHDRAFQQLWEYRLQDLETISTLQRELEQLNHGKAVN